MTPVGERARNLIESPITKVAAVAVGIFALSGCSSGDDYNEASKSDVIALTPVERVMADYYNGGVASKIQKAFPDLDYNYYMVPYEQEVGCGEVFSGKNLDVSSVSGWSVEGDTDRPGFDYNSTTDTLTVTATNGQEAKFAGFNQAEKTVQPLDQKTSDILAAYGCNIPPVNPSNPSDLPELTPED